LLLLAPSVTITRAGHKTSSIFRRYDITDEQGLREALNRLQHGQFQQGGEWWDRINTWNY